MIIGKYLQLIKGKYPSKLNKFLRAAPDPSRIINGRDITEEDFTDSVSVFRFGLTNKTTSKHRHVLSDQAILDNLEEPQNKIFLDIGASDGVTSLDLIKKLNHNFSHYFITDYNLNVGYKNINGWHLFFDIKTNECIFISNQHFFLRPLAIAKLKKWRAFRGLVSYENVKILPLINPQIFSSFDYAQGKITILEHDIMQIWKGPSPDVIKIANVLNRVYFSDNEIIKALTNAFKVLSKNGLLAIIHNIENVETCTLVKKMDCQRIEIISKINGGAQVQNLLTETSFLLRD